MNFTTKLSVRISRSLDVTSRIVVLLSTAAALCLEASLGTRAWASLLPLTFVSTAAGFAIARWRPRAAWSVLLGTLYIAPLIYRIVLNRDDTAYTAVWMGGCFGAVLASGVVRGWKFPLRARGALAYWALAVALVWPIIVFRETDFWWPLMNVDRIGNSGHGGPPAVIAVWIANVALTHLIGLLWFESATSQPAFAGEPAFMRNAVLPLAIGAGLGCALALYQGTVDVLWLTAHQWGAENRAAGSLLDGDAFGALAALWVLAFLAIASRARPVWGAAIAVVFAPVALGAVWATSSRIALLGAAAGVLFVVAASVSLLRTQGRVRARLTAVAVVALVLIAGFAGVLRYASSQNPIARLRATIPNFTEPEVRRVLDKEVWNRGGPYGDVSLEMAQAFPVAGVGIGSFNHIFPDWAYADSLAHGSHYATSIGRYPFDNAQSWYRHQLAELGLVGSLGWIVWVVFFAGVLCWTGGRNGTQPAAWLIKGALCVAALISLVAMPTQNFAVSLTVWVLTAWYLNLSPAAASIVGVGRETVTPWLLPRVLVAAGLGVFVWASVRVGQDRLRPPMRAVLSDWTYRYGVDATENPDGVGGEPYAWTTARRAVVVVPARPGQWVRVSISAGPPDVKGRPLHVRVSSGDREIADLAKFEGLPLTWYVRVRDREWGFMLQIDTDRTWSPGGADKRQLGLRVEQLVARWEQPPLNAIQIY